MRLRSQRVHVKWRVGPSHSCVEMLYIGQSGVPGATADSEFLTRRMRAGRYGRTLTAYRLANFLDKIKKPIHLTTRGCEWVIFLGALPGLDAELLLRVRRAICAFLNGPIFYRYMRAHWYERIYILAWMRLRLAR